PPRSGSASKRLRQWGHSIWKPRSCRISRTPRSYPRTPFLTPSTPSDRLPTLPLVDTFRRSVAEFVGTFTLIFIGGGAGIVSGRDIVAVALANGLAIGIMVSNLGHISGGHFNPAVTLGFVATRRIAAPLAVCYWVAQLLGAVAAALILRGLFSHAEFLGAVPHAPGVGGGKGFVIELVLTFFLVWTVFATAVDPRGAFK